MNPSLVLRGGPSGPTFEPSTVGYVLTVQADGKSIAPAPGGTGTIDASEVVNDSDAPGLSVADALTAMSSTPSFPIDDNAGNAFTGAQSITVFARLARHFTLTGNCTLTITELVAGRSQWAQFRVIQGAGGGFTLSIVGAKTPGGAGLTLSNAAGSSDIVSVYWDGTALYAQVAGLAFS